MDIAREVEKAKVKCFMSKYSGFIGSLLCNVDIQLTDDVPTAATNGIRLRINPDFFGKLDPDQRVALLLHEMHHIGRLHNLRLGSRNPELFNVACDIVINNGLEKEGYSIPGWLTDHQYDNWSEEEIYEKLETLGPKAKDSLKDALGGFGMPPGSSQERSNANGKGNTFKGDVEPAIGDSESDTENIRNKILNKALKANQEQSRCKDWCDGVGGELNKLLNKFLEPKLPWQTILRKFLTDLTDPVEPTWRRPNRRYTDMYLPSKDPDENKLEHLVFFLDTSGSITDEQLDTFNSELKYIWDTLEPRKLTMVQFHTEISKEDELKEGDPFNGITIASTGGTSYVCVHDYIEKVKPTAAVVFTDLYCEPMEPVKDKTPVYWIAVNTDKTEDCIKYGEYIKLEN